MNAFPTGTPRTPAPHIRKSRAARHAFAALLGLIAFSTSAPAQNGPLTIGQAEGNNSTVTGPGLKLTLVEIFSFDSAPAWKLTSFSWLSPKRSGANPTGRGQLLVFDAAKFNPAGKTYTEVNSETRGLVAISSTYAGGEYVFRGGVVLERGKTYYFLNSAAVTTDREPAAPYLYGFSTSRVFNNLERWQADASAWSATASPGSPNFSATFIPIPAGITSAR